jgi:hypothetical protein
MPNITDIMDVAIEDLSLEQLQQLKDATDQFQQKCLMSFKKNRSGIPYLTNEMPRVLLSGESDATTLQEKEECMQAFRDAAEDVLSRHHRAFLGVFKQMMVASLAQAWSRCSIEHPLKDTVWKLESLALPNQGLSHRYRASRSSLLRRVLGAGLSSLLRKAPEVSQFNLLCGLQEDSRSSHPHRAVQVNQFNS